jgi:7-cyano-7-deazaguanine reductase
MKNRVPKTLTTFPNPSPERDYLVRIEIPEFTCRCPMSGQPDFARFELEFIPDRRNVELKSLKLYVVGYREQGVFHEADTNRVLDALVAAIAPRFLRITARWNVRGGIYTTVVAEHRKRGWNPANPIELPVVGDHDQCSFEVPGERGQQVVQTIGLPEVEGTHTDLPDPETRGELGAFLMRAVFRNKYIWLVSFANFFVYTLRYGMLDWGPTMLTQVKHMSIGRAGWLVAAKGPSFWPAAAGGFSPPKSFVLTVSSIQ